MLVQEICQFLAVSTQFSLDACTALHVECFFNRFSYAKANVKQLSNKVTSITRNGILGLGHCQHYPVFYFCIMENAKYDLLDD
jgi:hypothetical protein